MVFNIKINNKIVQSLEINNKEIQTIELESLKLYGKTPEER